MKMYIEYPDSSKVWVYQSNRFFDDDEVNYLRVKLDDFTSSWESHGDMLKATFEIMHNLFVVLFVDEEWATMCGRAQDASINLIKQLEEELEVKLIDRMVQAYKKGDAIHVTDLDGLTKLLENGELDESTIVYNNTVTTKGDFDSLWEVPIKKSWHNRLMSL